MTTKRSDEHRPSAINPAEYQYVAEDYMRVDTLGDALCLKAQRERIAAHMAATGGKYSQHEHGGNCMVCGSVNAIYTSMFYHQKSNSYVRMGHDCADKCDMGGSFERNAFRKAVENVREHIAGKKKAHALLADAGNEAAWVIYEEDFEALRSRLNVQSLPYEEGKIRDIVGNLIRYGSISPTAMKFVGDLLARIPNRDARNAERTARFAAERADAKDCPTGRIQITGTVVKVAEYEGHFGTTEKMVVKSTEGFLVYGTATTSVDKGDTVNFTATVTPSDKDTKFGFFKRPAKLVVTRAAVEVKQ